MRLILTTEEFRQFHLVVDGQTILRNGVIGPSAEPTVPKREPEPLRGHTERDAMDDVVDELPLQQGSVLRDQRAWVDLSSCEDAETRTSSLVDKRLPLVVTPPVAAGAAPTCEQERPTEDHESAGPASRALRSATAPVPEIYTGGLRQPGPEELGEEERRLSRWVMGFDWKVNMPQLPGVPIDINPWCTTIEEEYRANFERELKMRHRHPHNIHLLFRRGQSSGIISSRYESLRMTNYEYQFAKAQVEQLRPGASLFVWFWALYDSWPDTGYQMIEGRKFHSFSKYDP